MLRSIKEITGYKLATLDGKIGRCKDFLFDDEYWTVRYMVADTGHWLLEHKVLIAPTALGEPEWTSRRFPVRLTRQQVEEAPKLEEHAPVSRQYEEKYYSYYGWPYYWAAAYAGKAGAYAAPVRAGIADEEDLSEEALAHPHLRSVDEVSGYDIQAIDGEIGHLEDFIVEDGTWIIRYLVIDTRNWLPGRKVLVAPAWIDGIDWKEDDIYVALPRETIKKGPEYDPTDPVNREYEEKLYNYYGQPVYWS